MEIEIEPEDGLIVINVLDDDGDIVENIEITTIKRKKYTLSIERGTLGQTLH